MKVTGNLADALNWSSEASQMFAKYMSEDVVTAEDAFNEALKECSTEQERQELITETLTALYGDAAKKYEEASGSQLDAKEATAENSLAQQDLANAIEPVTTKWEGLKTVLIQGITPAIEKVSGGLQTALGWLEAHPTAFQAITAAITVFAVGLSALAIAWGVYTVAQWAANSAMLASPVTWIVLGVIAAISALVAIIVVVVNKWEEIKAVASNCLESIKGAWGTFTTWIDTNIIQPAKNLFTSLWEGIKSIWDTICNAVQVAVMFIGSIISAAFNAIKNVITTVFNAVKNFITPIWNSIKNAITTAVNAIKSVITTVWNGIKNVITTVVNAVKTKVTSVFNSIKSTVSGVFNGIKSTATSVWNGIKNAITTPIETAKNKVKSALDGIKGFFDNLKLKFPNIKLPHFSISGKFSLDPPSVPKLKIDWYAKGAIFTKPTIFGTGAGYKGVGEAGAEAVLPIEKLKDYIEGSIEKASNVVNMQPLADAIEDLAERAINLNINGRTFAQATASDTDSVGGLRNTFKGRGLVLE